MMTPEQIRLKQNPVLTNLLIGMVQGGFIAESLFPRLPQALRGITIAEADDAHLKRYNLRRTPGAATKRVDINYEGKTYTVKQYSVEVPIPRELMQEAEAARALNIATNLEPSRLAMSTANDILLLDYELEVAALATNVATYASNQTLALAGATKWSADTGTPVTDVRTAASMIRKAAGVRPNLLALAADVFDALVTNKEVRGYLPGTQMGPATADQLKTILGVADIKVGDAIWKDGSGKGTDVWGNNAILSYSPQVTAGSMSLATPAFGFTNVLPGHPYAETPYYDNGTKSWIYGVTYERQPNVAMQRAGFLFTNPK